MNHMIILLLTSMFFFLSDTLSSKLSVNFGSEPLAATYFFTEPSDIPKLSIETGRHTARINRIATDAQGRWVATASDDKTARLFEVASGRLLRTFRPPIGDGDEGKLYAAALKSDGSLLAVAGWTGFEWEGKSSIYVFDTSSGKMIRRISAIPRVIRHLSFSPDGTSLAATLEAAGLRLFSLNDGRVGRDPNYAGDSHSVHFAFDGRMVTSSWDGYIRLYKKTGGDGTSFDDGQGKKLSRRLLIKYKAPGGNHPHGVRFSPDGEKIAVGYEDSPRVDILDARNLRFIFSADSTGITRGDLGNVAWSTDGSILYAGGRYGKGGVTFVRRWQNAGKGKPEDLSTGISNTIMDLVPLPEGGLLIAAGGPVLALLHRSGESRIVMASPIADFRNDREGLKISGDGKEFSFGYELYGKARYRFSLLSRNLMPEKEGDDRDQTLSAMLLKPILAVPGTSIEGWEMNTEPKLNGTVLKLWQNERSCSLAIAPDGNRFLLGTEWRMICYSKSCRLLWDKKVPDVVRNINIDRDGRVVLAAYGDGTIRWHRMIDGKELLAFFPHADRKRWVLWTPEGFFDHSPGGADLIGWHLNRGKNREAAFIPVDKFYKEYHRPDLVDRAFAGEDLSGFAKAIDIKKLLGAGIPPELPIPTDKLL